MASKVRGLLALCFRAQRVAAVVLHCRVPTRSVVPVTVIHACPSLYPLFTAFNFAAHAAQAQGGGGGYGSQGGCAGNLGNTVCNAMANGFGWTLGSDAANELVHGLKVGFGGR